MLFHVKNSKYFFLPLIYLVKMGTVTSQPQEIEKKMIILLFIFKHSGDVFLKNHILSQEINVS